MFVVKQIVWAKVKNYPWWPAQVKPSQQRQTNCRLPKIIILKLLLLDKPISTPIDIQCIALRKSCKKHLKSNTYKGLQNSIDLANNELQKRKALIEQSQNKFKNMKNCDKGKKIKKNTKNNKRKSKVKQKIAKNSKSFENNLGDRIEQKQKVQIKNDIIESPCQKPVLVQYAQQKSQMNSVNLSQDCEAQSAEFNNQIEFMRSVDRKKIEHTQQILFSYITRFNSNLFDKERECLQAIQKIVGDEFKPQQLIQSKITNMITYLYKKLTERNSSTLKKEELEKINKIKTNLIQKAYNYLFDCSYYDQFIKRMQKNVSLNNIEKEQNKKNQPKVPTKKYRKYKRKQKTNKKIQHA